MLHALIPVVTPLGSLRLDQAGGEFVLGHALAERLESRFKRGPGHGLLQLGASETGSVLPPDLSWWRDFAMRFIAELCALGENTERTEQLAIEAPSASFFSVMIDDAPPMQGGEYLRPGALATLWQAMQSAIELELAESKLTLQAFLTSRDSRWRLVGRVHFNLAENRRDADFPFAFMATYTSGLSTNGALRHQPLGQALREFSGAGDKSKLLKLLAPVQQASEACAWLKSIVDTGEIFHPLKWTSQDAMRLLLDSETIERAGLVIRMPASWQANRPSRAIVEASVGSASPSLLGADAMLDFKVSVSLDGERLTTVEIDELLSSIDGLALLRGKWVEVDSKKLQAALDRFKAVERLAEKEGLPFREAMRLLAGADIGVPVSAAPTVKWAHVTAGNWLAQALEGCRSPESLKNIDPGAGLRATLRPYQQTGLSWLHLLTQLGLGACLADDMGLGKTIQVLALLTTLDNSSKKATRKTPSLLVAPASLLGNWATEAERFTPGLKILIAHPSFRPVAELQGMTPESLDGFDLVVTSYATLLRQKWIEETSWRLVVLDEAQVIKNPNAKQTRAVKSLKTKGRIVLTGTPIENNLRDLWSIFDFVNPGLLGSSKAFANFVKQLASQPHVSFAPLRKLVQPYILRRMKTDKGIIADLPDKTEVKAYCHLSRKQAALYSGAVAELEERLKKSDDGIARSGLVLSMLIRLKQICNHPTQWLGDGAYHEADSGKFARLLEIAETVASRQEKLLVFTQFKEIIPPIERLLGSAFGRQGLSLHGGTPVGKRNELVKQFQDDERTPYFVLSIKAGGAGLNLTAASHVVHFDRWWNPAVENQATDRAFRIGQKRNVLVHKFVCRGTIEDRIDQLIETKRKLAEDFLSTGGEINLTEISDHELLSLVTLDIDAAMMERGNI